MHLLTHTACIWKIIHSWSCAMAFCEKLSKAFIPIYFTSAFILKKNFPDTSPVKWICSKNIYLISFKNSMAEIRKIISSLYRLLVSSWLFHCPDPWNFLFSAHLKKKNTEMVENIFVKVMTQSAKFYGKPAELSRQIASGLGTNSTSTIMPTFESILLFYPTNFLAISLEYLPFYHLNTRNRPFNYYSLIKCTEVSNMANFT